MTVKLQLQNKIINGAFDYWQRGTSLAMPNNNASYLADRWSTHRVGAAWAYTVARSTDVPAESNGQYSMQLSTTTAAAMAAGDYAIIAQSIEGNVLRGFKNKKMVVSFWVKSTKTGVFCAQVCANTAPNRRYLIEYTVNTSNTWEKKTFRFTHDSTGTWDYSTGAGLLLVFTIAAGDNYFMTANSWQTTATNAFKTTNQVNGMDNVANVFKIADVVMVEDNEGQTREPDFMYAGRDVFEELELCQRYFEKSWRHDIAIGTAYISQATIKRCSISPYFLGACDVQFKVSKRTTPIVTAYNAAVGSAGSMAEINGGSTHVANRGFGYSSTATGFTFNGVGDLQTSAGFTVCFEYTADAEL